MALDPEKAAFLLQEYRASVTQDAAVLADYPNARHISIDTGLDGAGAAALSAELLALLKQPARAFAVELIGADNVRLADFDGTPPAYVLDAPRFATTGNEALLPVALEIDFETGRIVLTLRG